MRRDELTIMLIILAVMTVLNIYRYTRRLGQAKFYAAVLEEGTRKISINNASRDELESLPGIGPGLAQRIIEQRRKIGAFKRLEELREVKGVGEKVFQRIMPFLEL